MQLRIAWWAMDSLDTGPTLSATGKRHFAGDRHIFLILLKKMASLRSVVSKITQQPRLSRGIRSIHIEKRLQELNIELPPAPAPKANYNIMCHASNNTMYISGHLPLLKDGGLITGRIGEDGNDIPHGYKAARQCGLNILATLKNELGDLDRVDKIVKVSLYTRQWSR